MRMKLTASQYEGVNTTGVPCMINAGAGSGKTRVIVEKAATFIESGLEPCRLCAITFTKKAAAEMLERLYLRIGIKAYQAVICNWHSFALNQVIKPAIKKQHPYFVKCGYTSSDLVILDETESLTLINESAKKTLSNSDYEFLKEHGGAKYVQNFMGLSLSYGRGPKSEFEHQSKTNPNLTFDEKALLSHCVCIWKVYYRRMIELNAIDYDHILVHAVKILTNDVGFRTWLQNQFKAVLADEHQDANPVQGLLLKLIVGQGNNLTMVGDEKQSIYAFRAADVGQLLNAQKEFGDMKIVQMGENFRSTEQVVNVANAIADLMHEDQKVTDGHMIAMANIQGDKPIARQFANDKDEAITTANEIKQAIESGELKPEEIAILYRSKVIKDPIEAQLIENGVEYRVVGDKDFFDSKEVKDWSAFLRFCANEKDVMAASRVIDAASLKTKGVTMRQKLIDKNLTVIEYCKYMTTYGTVKSQDRKLGFVSLLECHSIIKEALFECGSITDLAKINNYELSDSELRNKWGEVLSGLEEGLHQIWVELFKPKIIDNAKKKYKTQEMTAEVISEVNKREQNVITLTKRLFAFTELHGHLHDCIKELNMLVDSGEQGASAVQLMTEHASKGLEFKRVYVIGCEEEAHFKGNEKDNVHEELRLFYVATTRAEKDLIYSYAQRRLVHGEFKTRKPLQFLCALPVDLLYWESSISPKVAYEKSHEETTTKRTGNPIQMLARGQLPHPKLTVEVKETRIEGFKI